MSKVVNMRHEKADMRIDRQSKWGNPYRMGQHGTRDGVIKKYRRWIERQQDLLDALPELEGKTLGCWCAPLPCHGDELVKLLEEPE